MTSSWEGFPLSLCEAMACSLPVVATDCPTGPSEILSDNCLYSVSSPTYGKFGMLLPLLDQPHRIQEAASAISNLLSDDLQLINYRESGPDRIRSFSTSITLPQIKSLIEGIA
jgi:glycosyltransferase involved in cell wall biosynthesis